MEKTTATDTLVRFRQQVYEHVLGHRKDSLFELMEAVLVASRATPLVRLSLEPVFRRRWASAPDALADGTLDDAAVRRLVQAEGSAEPAGERARWVVDGTVWPRPAAETSPARTWGHRVAPGRPAEGIVPSWEYPLLVDLPRPGRSWIRPLGIARRGPTAGAPRPLVTFDSQYDVLALAQAIHALDAAERLAIDVLLRLPKRRRFSGTPPPYSGHGAPRKHGEVFDLRKPQTQDAPDHTATTQDPRHGTVQVDVWDALHDQHDATIHFPVIRVQVERLPKSRKRPEPLWLGEAPLPDPLDYWREYTLRFTVEQGIRFWKQDLGWTTIRVRDPAAADRWSWLLVLVWWQLWLARTLVADQRLPWERPRPPAELSPGRVRRDIARLLPWLGCPTRAVRPRGKSPGRRPGERPPPRHRYPVVKRAAARAA